MERSVDNNIFGFGVMRRLILFLAAVMLSSQSLCAQEQIPLMDSYNNIVQSRFGALAIIPLNPKWELSLGGQVRTLANMSDVDKIMAIAMVNYSPRMRIAVGTEYKINMRHRMDFYYMIHFNRSYDARYKANSGDIKEWSLEKVCAHVIGIDYKFKL